MLTMAALIRAKESVEDEFLKRENVTGVSIGTKKTGGVDTCEPAIIVYVAEKKDTRDLSMEEVIPKRVGNIETDVVQRTFVLHPLMARVLDMELQVDPIRYDTITGGISIGPCRSVHLEPPDVETPGEYVFTGTLGAVVKDNTSGKDMLLSNFHVMCIDNQWKVGDKMGQQSLVDGGRCPAEVVGELQRAALTESVDCAICSYTADRSISYEIREIGDVAGVADAAFDMAVRKRGRTTGLTYGRVVSTALSVKINYGDGLGERILRNQIDIEPDRSKNNMFGDHGDSGSVVVNDKNQVIGLHFAGDTTGSGVANPIKAVMDALNITISQKSVEQEDRCKKYEPYLKNVLLLSYRKPLLHACLCHYVCGVGGMPRCPTLETAIVKRVINALSLCPHLKEDFCRRLFCSAGVAGITAMGRAATLEEEMAQAELELAALEMEEPYIEEMTMGELGASPEELELVGFAAPDEMLNAEIEFAAAEAMQLCQIVVPYLRGVIAAAKADPQLRRCLCYYICRVGSRPACTSAHIDVVLKVARILNICPKYRAPFCRVIHCA